MHGGSRLGVFTADTPWSEATVNLAKRIAVSVDHASVATDARTQRSKAQKRDREHSFG
jgi:hypothetical protein